MLLSVLDGSLHNTMLALCCCFVCHLQDPVHQALAKCSEMRPSVDISVGGENSSVGVGAGAARTEFRSTVAA
jgi:hypothetical protein